MGMSGGVVQ